jgi:hypothetical protein
MNALTAHAAALTAYPIFGGTQPQYGINVKGDVLVNKLNDGTDLNEVPDTYGFNGIDASQTNGDTVALTYPGAINGLSTDVRFHWNGNTVELIGNTAGH